MINKRFCLSAFENKVVQIKEKKSNFFTPTFLVRSALKIDHNLSQKGMKYEWATVKGDSGNEELYIGGIGKELQLPNGEVDTKDAMWITIIGPQGQLKRVDWSPQYNFVRKFLGCQLPGYIAHEAIESGFRPACRPRFGLRKRACAAIVC